MGLVVDTNIFLLGECRGWSLRRVLLHVQAAVGEEELALSAITATEMIQGIYRADADLLARKREEFVRGALLALPVISFNEETAWIAGRIRGQQAAQGNTLPFADSLIAATALAMNFGVLTANTRDFERIPGLRVVAAGAA